MFHDVFSLSQKMNIDSLTDIDCLALMPIGPRANINNVIDSIEAFEFYIDNRNSILVILDDSHKEILSGLALPNNVEVIRTDSLLSFSSLGHATVGLFFVKQALCLKAMAMRYRWKCMMRIDDDALIIGPNPQEDAIAFFAAHPLVGQLGAYKRRGDGSDKTEAMAEKGRLILRQLFSPRNLIHPTMLLFLFFLLKKAKNYKYNYGDMCTGGSFFLSKKVTDFIVSIPNGILNSAKDSILDDDLLFSICSVASGCNLFDFSDLDQVMAINWRHLPMSLEELCVRGKKVVHPVKEEDDERHEQDVRKFFHERRVV